MCVESNSGVADPGAADARPGTRVVEWLCAEHTHTHTHTVCYLATRDIYTPAQCRNSLSCFTGRLSNKFVKNMAIENVTTPQMCTLATLPCYLSLITTLVSDSECRLFSDDDVYQVV